jgi:hypothetical protein
MSCANRLGEMVLIKDESHTVLVLDPLMEDTSMI